MRPASREHDTPLRRQPLEPGIAIDLEHAPEAGQVARRTLALAVGAVEVNHRRRIRSQPGPVIPGVSPEPADPHPAGTGVQRRHRRVVREQLGRGKHVFSQFAVQHLEPPARLTGPAGEHGAVDLDTVAGQDLGLSVERHVVGVAADDDMGQQRRCRQSLRDRLFRRRRLMQRAAAATGVLGPTDAQRTRIWAGT